MEYLILTAALVLFVLVIFLREVYLARKREERFVRSLYEEYGKLPEKKDSPEAVQHVDSYYKRHKRKGQIDDITWNDLELSEVWKLLNYAYSASGEEYLYYMLRDVCKDEDQLTHLEDVIRFFEEHADERVKIQYRMHELGHTGKYSLYDYLENLDYLGNRSNTKNYFCDMLFVILVALIPVQASIAILGLAILSVYNILTYFQEKKQINPYLVSFAYLSRLIVESRKLLKIDVKPCALEWERIRANVEVLAFLQKGSYWMFAQQTKMTGGNPLEAILDYVRMIFHVDLIIFNKKLSRLKASMNEVDELIGLVGFLESTIAIGAFRKSLAVFCVPELGREGLEAEGMFHPSLTDPVKNSISVSRGVLLTGSNASGKSTFLKTVAVNAILAQTIHTCAASAFRAPFFEIYSSMALRDNMQSKESYYIVEIKALKRVLDAVRDSDRTVLCFVDEVLRGTNTVERIAASTQILKALSKAGCICFAATHDVELTGLLADYYDNYHFEEEIKDGDILFPYRLMKGAASTRNAIKLLEVMGYDPAIIEDSMKQADRFMASGSWEMT